MTKAIGSGLAAAGAMAVVSAAGLSAGLLQAATANMAKALTKERRRMRKILSTKEERVQGYNDCFSTSGFTPPA